MRKVPNRAETEFSLCACTALFSQTVKITLDKTRAHKEPQCCHCVINTFDMASKTTYGHEHLHAKTQDFHSSSYCHCSITGRLICLGTRTYVVGPFYSFGPSSVAGRKHSPPPVWESNPGLSRDRRGYSPLYYRGLGICRGK